MNKEHTPEPWGYIPQKTGNNQYILVTQKTTGSYRYIGYINDINDINRIVPCVNAMAGIEDPEQWMKATKEALEVNPDAPECNCINEGLEKIKQLIIAEKGQLKGFKVESIDWEHRSWYPKVRLYSNIIADYTFEKKDGTRSRTQHMHSPVIYNYCPFCGQKIKADKKEEKK